MKKISSKALDLLIDEHPNDPAYYENVSYGIGFGSLASAIGAGALAFKSKNLLGKLVLSGVSAGLGYLSYRSFDDALHSSKRSDFKINELDDVYFHNDGFTRSLTDHELEEASKLIPITDLREFYEEIESSEKCPKPHFLFNGVKVKETDYRTREPVHFGFGSTEVSYDISFDTTFNKRNMVFYGSTNKLEDSRAIQEIDGKLLIIGKLEKRLENVDRALQVPSIAIKYIGKAYKEKRKHLNLIKLD